MTFQLTPSRRATTYSLRPVHHAWYFNSRPHGGRLHQLLHLVSVLISTHALTEGDTDFSPADSGSHISTHALTEGDIFPEFPLRPYFISTHALTEGDSKMSEEELPFRYFNSRPHGGRRTADSVKPAPTHFNSRPHGGRLDLLRYLILSFESFQLTPSRRATANLDKFFF